MRGAALVERLPAYAVAGSALCSDGAGASLVYRSYINRLTTVGDILHWSGFYVDRLAAGAAGTYLQGKGAGVLPAYEQPMPPLTTKGDILYQGATVPERLAAAAAGLVLSAEGVAALPTYRDLFNLLTTKGDLWVQGVVNPERLGAGALDTYFKGQGAGVLPIYEKMHLKDTGIKIGSGTRNSSGAQVVSGVGFQPSVVLFFGLDTIAGDLNMSWGFDDGTVHMSIRLEQDGVAHDLNVGASIYIQLDVSNYIYGLISALGSDGFTITWTLNGTRACRYVYLALP